MAYIDHNMLQEGPNNMDDHLYIQSVAKKHGVYFSRPGNGICHQVEIERFGVPGQTLAGLWTATPPPAAASVCWPSALADWTWPWPWPAVNTTSPCPQVVQGGTHRCSAQRGFLQDIILEVLRQCTVKGGVQQGLRIHWPRRGDFDRA